MFYPGQTTEDLNNRLKLEWKMTIDQLKRDWELNKLRMSYLDKQQGEYKKPSVEEALSSIIKEESKAKTGLRYNSGKLKWSLVDFPSFEPMVKVLEFGAHKYAAHNWKKGLKVSETIDSMLRHIYALIDGEDTDPESKLPHIGHIQCNAMFLAFMLKNRPDLDDRHKVED